MRLLRVTAFALAVLLAASLGVAPPARAADRAELLKTLRLAVRSGDPVLDAGRLARAATRYDRLPAFPSRFLKQKRDILILLPLSYGRDRARRYPVLYLHDGNNLFDAATAFGGREWQVDETVDRLVREGKLAECLVVGVYNTPDRIWEYTPTDGTHQGGGADAYLRFLVEELKPAIDRRYRTLADRDHTVLGGSSLGGLVSLHAALKRPQAFGRILAMSPSLWWDGCELAGRVKGLAKPFAGTRFWFDTGTAEGDPVEGCGETDAVLNARAFDRLLRAKGLVDGRDYVYVEDPGAGHNEPAWARRLPAALEWLCLGWK